MDLIKSPYNSSGVAAASALKLMGVEDKPHNHNATVTMYKQSLVKFMESQSANFIQPFGTTNFNRTLMVVNMNKLPDFMGPSRILAYWPAIGSADESGDYGWINGRGFMMIAEVEFKAANLSLWKMTGRDMANMATLFADFEHLEEEVGICRTTMATRILSKKPLITYTPLVGMANQKHTQNYFTCASVLFAGLTIGVTAPNMIDLIVPYGNARAMLTNVLDKETRNPINSSSVAILLATKYVHVSVKQRVATIKNYNQNYFKETLCAGEKSFLPCATEHTEIIDISMIGPVTTMFLIVQSKKDVADKKPFKVGKDDGSDYVKFGSFLQNGTPREDGIPFKFHRISKVLDTFKHVPERQIYVLQSFSEDETVHNYRNHQNMTNVDKKSVSVVIYPHDTELEFRVVYTSINGWFTEDGNPGKLWD